MLNVCLLGHLLLHEVEEACHFLREDLGHDKALAEEHDLGNHRHVGQHHRDGSEDGLDVIWELCSSRVPCV